jgi:hypothetical protein
MQDLFFRFIIASFSQQQSASSGIIWSAGHGALIPRLNKQNSKRAIISIGSIVSGTAKISDSEVMASVLFLSLVAFTLHSAVHALTVDVIK